MNTNGIALPFPTPVAHITHAANSLGINVTEEQVGMAMAAATIGYRWGKLELGYIRANGGVKKMWTTFWTEFWGPPKVQPAPNAAPIQPPKV